MTDELETPSVEETGFEDDFKSFVENEDPIEQPEVISEEEAPTPVEEPTVEPIQEEEVNPDWQTLYEEEKQYRRTVEGRFKKARDDWRDKEETLTTKPVADKPTVSHKEFWDEYDVMLEPVTALIHSIISDELSKFTPKLETIESTINDASVEAHQSAIAAAFPNWRDIAQSKELELWMNSLPYKSDDAIDGETAWNWFTNGSAQEVITLFTAFKESCDVQSKSTKQLTVPKRVSTTPIVDKVIAAQAVDEGVPTIPQTRAVESNTFEDDFKSFL